MLTNIQTNEENIQSNKQSKRFLNKLVKKRSRLFTTIPFAKGVIVKGSRASYLGMGWSKLRLKRFIL